MYLPMIAPYFWLFSLFDETTTFLIHTIMIMIIIQARSMQSFNCKLYKYIIHLCTHVGNLFGGSFFTTFDKSVKSILFSLHYFLSSLAFQNSPKSWSICSCTVVHAYILDAYNSILYVAVNPAYLYVPSKSWPKWKDWWPIKFVLYRLQERFKKLGNCLSVEVGFSITAFVFNGVLKTLHLDWQSSNPVS